MREITVKYELSDEEERRLERLAEEYRKQGLNKTADRIFQFIMATGSEADISRKFKARELQLNIIPGV